MKIPKNRMKEYLSENYNTPKNSQDNTAYNKDMSIKNKKLIEIANSIEPEVSSPPILQHKDNISELTIFNTGYDAGYYKALADSEADISMWYRLNALFFLGVGIVIGLIIGIVLK